METSNSTIGKNNLVYSNYYHNMNQILTNVGSYHNIHLF